MNDTPDSPPKEIIEAARLAAMRSPCAKSKRGAVLFALGARPAQSPPPTDDLHPEHAAEILRQYAAFPNGVIEVGHNGPPQPFTCDGSPGCRRDCAQICVHAEARALLRRSSRDWAADEFPELLHLKVIGETAVATGKPSCVQCSVMIREIWFVMNVWLYERARPEPRCVACGDPAKHLVPSSRPNIDALACDRHATPYETLHEHARCLAWQIREANDGATWKRYTALEFHEATLANLGLHAAKKDDK